MNPLESEDAEFEDQQEPKVEITKVTNKQKLYDLLNKSYDKFKTDEKPEGKYVSALITLPLPIKKKLGKMKKRVSLKLDGSYSERIKKEDNIQLLKIDNKSQR